jgi:hypothetical protein
MKINFCGDSFCRSDKPHSWTTLLARHLNADIIGLGKDGTAHEHAFRTFNHKSDYTIFCWTEPHRLYHPVYSINMAKCEDYKDSDPVYAAGHDYYKHIHDWDYMTELQNREFYWFDNEILSNYSGSIVHLYSFYTPTYKFRHGHDTRLTLSGYIVEDEYANHMSKDHNDQLAVFLYHKIIKNA